MSMDECDKNQTPHGTPKPVVPLREFLPGYDWTGDNLYREYCENLTERQIEFAKATVHMPKASKATCLHKICPELSLNTVNSEGAKISKEPGVEELRLFLVELRTRAREDFEYRPIKREEIIAGFTIGFRRAVSEYDVSNINKLGDKLMRLLSSEKQAFDGVAEPEIDVNRMLADALKESKEDATDGDEDSEPDVPG